MQERGWGTEVSRRAGSAQSERSWDRLPREGGEAYDAFRRFLNRGPARRIIDVAAEVRKSEGLLRRWARQYNWWDRAAAYDAHMARRQEEAELEGRQEVARRRRRLGRQLENLGMAVLTRFIHRDPETGEIVLDPGITPRDAVHILRLAVDLQGAPAGEDTDERGPTAEQALGALDNEALRRLVELAEQDDKKEGDNDGDDHTEEET